MTQRPGHDHPDQPDPEQFAADYLARAERMWADSVRQTRALQAVAAESTSGPVTVRVGTGGRLEAFTVSGQRPSATQLSQGFAEAYREGLRVVNGAVAQHSGGLDDQVTSFAPPAGPEDDRRRPPRAELVEPDGGAQDGDAQDGDDPALRLPSDAAFDTLLEKLDQGDPEDLDAVLNDPEFQRLLPPGHPDTWQQQLEREVQQISRNAGRVVELAQTAVGEHSTRELTIEVTSAGSVESLRFHRPVDALSADEIGEQVLAGYAEAAADAARKLSEGLAELGMSSDHG